MDANGVTLVCFDLGGVLIRICRSWSEGCEAAGIPVRDPFTAPEHRPVLRSLVEAHQTGRIDGATYFRRMSEDTGGIYTPQEVAAVHRSWMLGEYDGLESVIDRLHARGIRTAALSNTNHEHWTQISAFGAVMRLEHLLASHLLGLHKPDPAIYHALERQLGVIGSEIVFFDDSKENVVAARAVGWRAHEIDPLGSPARQITDTLRAVGVID